MLEIVASLIIFSLSSLGSISIGKGRPRMVTSPSYLGHVHYFQTMRAPRHTMGSTRKRRLDVFNEHHEGHNVQDSLGQCQRQEQEDECTSCRSRNQMSNSSTTTTTTTTESTTYSSTQFYIRKARYMELGHVVEILVDSFYKPSDLVRPYLFLHELSRLQKNFPHNVVHSTAKPPDHVFYVACTTAATSSSTCKVEHSNGTASKQPQRETIVGFVEVDSRPGKKQNDAPRPYLSDLAVHRNYRRNGIAKALIETCEKQVLDGWKQSRLYLRVDRENYAARNMYTKLGYEWQPHDYFGHGRDTTMLLKKEWENVDVHSFDKEGEEYDGDICLDVDAKNRTVHDIIEKRESVAHQQPFLLDFVI